MVGSAPPVNTPIESVPSPALSTKSNLTATLFAMPCVPEPAAGRPDGVRAGVLKDERQPVPVPP